MIRKIWQNITTKPFSITDTDPDCDVNQSSQTSILSQTNLPSEDDSDCARGYDDASLQQRVQAVVEMECENKQNVILTPNDSSGLDPFQIDKMQKKKPDRTFYQDLLQQTNTNPQTDTFTDSLLVHVIRDEHVNHENNRKRSRSPDNDTKPTTPRKRQKCAVSDPFKHGIALIREEQNESEFSRNSRKRTIDLIADTDSESDDEPPKKKAKRSPCVTPTPRHHLKLYRIKDASPEVSSCCNIHVLSKQKMRYTDTYTMRLSRIYARYNMANECKISGWVKRYGGDVDKMHELYTKVCAKYDLIPCKKYEGYSDALVDPNEMEVSKHASVKPIPIQQPRTPTPQPQPQPRLPTPAPLQTLPMPPSASILISDNHSEASSVSTFHSPRKEGGGESERSVSLPVHVSSEVSSWKDQPNNTQYSFTFGDNMFNNPPMSVQPPMDTRVDEVDTSWMDSGPAMFSIPNMNENHDFNGNPFGGNMNCMDNNAPPNMSANPHNFNKHDACGQGFGSTNDRMSANPQNTSNNDPNGFFGNYIKTPKKKPIIKKKPRPVYRARPRRTQ